MDGFKRMLQVVRINFCGWKRDFRIWFILAFTAVLIIEYLKGFVIYGMENGKTLTFCMLPFLYMSSNISVRAPKMLWHIGFLLLICDAPFLHQNAPYMVLRSRRTSWWMGECLYIVLVALFYMTFITLVSSAVTLPVICLENDWGEAITDFMYGTSETSVLELFDTYELGMAWPELVIKFLYPFASQLYTFLTGWGTFVILGWLVYALSLTRKTNVVGLLTAGVFIFLDPILVYGATFRHYWLQAFSPICWTSVDSLNILYREYFLSIPFVMIMYPLVLSILLVIISRLSRKSIIEVRSEME
ncbi:MAG: hypothetical protein ACI4C1_06525 [Lachnospiraceae bacterium]